MAMTTTVRRASARKKNIRGQARETSRTAKGGFRIWINEALAVCCCALSLFLLLSFLSAQANWSGDSSSLTIFLAGAMGPVGKFVGTLLAGFFGWCALVPVLWTAWLSIYLWNRDDDGPLVEVKSWSLLALGVVAKMVICCALIGVCFGSPAGGSLGALIAKPLTGLFSTFGAALLLSVLLLAALALTTGQSIGSIARSVGTAAAFVLHLLVIDLPRVIARAAAFVWRVIARQLSAIAEVLLHGSGEKDEERIIPRPKLRRNVVEAEGDAKDNEGAEVDERQEGESTQAVEAGPPAVVERRVVSQPIGEKELRKVVRRFQEAAQESDNNFADYQPPDLKLLIKGEVSPGNENDQELQEISRQIEAKLRDFSVFGRVTHIHPGPVITLFEFEPAPGVKVGRIASLQDDLAMSLKASSIRILAPIPKRGTVGIEVPNRHRDIVRLRDLLESEAFVNGEGLLSVPIGKDTYGDPVIADISVMPHLLMAGSTGTGKSVSINALLVSLLYRASPADLGLILIDPKILELSTYEDIPHLRVPVVTVPKQARAVLEWAVHEMERRYRMMQKFGVRSIDSYNRIARGEEEREDISPPPKEKAHRLDEEVEIIREDGAIDEAAGALEGEPEAPEEIKPLPKIVIVIDELADLMLSVGRDIEELITRLAQKARAAGIHLIVATQRPSVDVITGLIKANFPARLSFRVSSRIDSRTILDTMGADKLLGRGDMLLMLPGAEALRRVHGAFVSDSEVKRVVSAIKTKCKPHYDQRIMAICEKALEEDAQGAASGGAGGVDEHDEMYDKAVELVLEKGQASTSMIQRAFRIGYNRAARIVEMMEREGIVGPMDGAKPREVRAPLPEDPAPAKPSPEPKDDLF